MPKHAKSSSKFFLLEYLDYLDELLKFVLFPIFVSFIIYLVFNSNSKGANTKSLKILLSYFELLVHICWEYYTVFGTFFLIICLTPFALELTDKTLVRKTCVVTIFNVFRSMIKVINILSFLRLFFIYLFYTWSQLMLMLLVKKLLRLSLSITHYCCTFMIF